MNARVQISIRLIIVMALLAACGGQTASGTASPEPGETTGSAPSSTTAPDSPKTLTIGYDVEPRSLDPYVDAAVLVQNYHRQVFSGLLRRDDELNLVGDLAESWEQIDPLTWEFRLQSGVKFHDGSDLTAADVKFSYDRMIDPELALHITSFVATIVGTEVVDDLTVRITTGAPDVLLPNVLTFGAWVLPEAAFNEAGPEEFGRHPIGSGPFKFVEWDAGEQIIMEANPDYFDGRPALDRLVWKFITEPSTRVSALRTGEVDLIHKLPVQDLAAVEEDPSLRTEAIRSARVIFFGFDTFHEPFQDNVALRQAINYAVDKDSIIESVLGGYAIPTVLAAPINFGVDPDMKPYPYDPDKARELLAEAGFPDGLEITAETTTGGYTPNDTELMQVVCGQLAEVNITCSIRQEEFGGFVQRWLRQEVRGMYVQSNAHPALDLDLLMGAHFHSTRRALYYSDPELDVLIEEAKSESDPDERLRIYKEIQDFVYEDAPWLFLFSADDIYGVNERVQNWVARSDEAIWVYEVDVN